MIVSYNGLWKLLIDKNMTRKDLEAKAKVSASTVAKMGRGELVAMAVLLRICEYMDCNIGDIVSFEKNKGDQAYERMKAVVDMYNNRRKDEAFANEVLDDVAEQLAQLLHELKSEKNSFETMGIDYEEKAFYDILSAVAKKYEFEYPEDKMIELSKEIKVVVDDKAKYTDFSTREDIKASLQVDLIVLLDKYGYPPVTIDDVYKEVLEQAENFKKYS